MSDLAFSPVLEKSLGRRRLQRPWLELLSVLLGLIGIGVSLYFGLSFWAVDSSQRLLPGDFTPKGLSPAIPTTDDLHLQVVGLERIGQFLAVQRSREPQAKEHAEACLYKVLELEQDADERTRSLLHLMLGDFFLWHEEYPRAIEHLERARSLASAHPLLVGWRLLLAYEGRVDQLLGGSEPWPEKEQEQRERELRDLYERLRELREEIRSRTVALRTLGAAGTDQAVWREALGTEDWTETSFFVRSATPSTLLFAYKEPEERVVDGDGERRALAVGVSATGPDGTASLRFATNDAERVAEGFRRIGYQATVLDHDRPTRASILRELMLEVLRSRPGDDFVAYFSGHGFVDERGDAALAVAEARARGLVEWLDKFEPSDAAGKVVLNYDVGDDVTLGNDSHFIHANGSLAAGYDRLEGYRNGFDALTLREIEAVLALHRGHATVLVDSCLTGNGLSIDDDGTLGNGMSFPIHDPVNGKPTFLGADAAVGLTDARSVRFLLAAEPGGIAVESNRLRAGVFTHALVSYLDLLAAQCAARPPAEDPRHRLRLLDEPGGIDGTNGLVCDIDLDDLYRYTAGETTRLAKALHGVVQRPMLIP